MQRKRENRMFFWALLAALVLHAVVALGLAAFAGRTETPVETDEKPVQLTMMDMPAAAPKKANPQFMETDPAKKSATAPKDKTFESNENSIAASEAPASGDSLLPSQNGKDRALPDLQNQSASLAMEGEQPQPSAQPQPKQSPTAAPTPVAKAQPSPSATPPPTATPLPTTTPQPTATPSPEELAMLTSTPPPTLRAPDELEPSPVPETEAMTPPPRPRPEQPSSAYRAYKEQTRISGRITNRGSSAVDAVGTPFGRYQKSIYDSIGSRWLYYTRKDSDLIAIGTAHVSFSIDREGHVENLKMLGNSSNEAFANVCLESIQEAKLPPVPPEVGEVLPSEGLTMDLTFTVFANQ